MKRILLLTLAAVLSLGAAVAAPEEISSSPAVGMRTGPSPEMKKLEFLVGKCTAAGKMFMPDQSTMEWSGTDTTSWMKGWSYIKSESKMTIPGMGVDESVTIMAYDQAAKEYRLWRYSSFTNIPIEASGNFEGDKLVMVSKPCEMGMVFRVTFEPKTKGKVAFLLEMKVGESFQKTQEGTFIIKA